MLWRGSNKELPPRSCSSMDNDQLIISCFECGTSFTLEEVRKGFVVFYDGSSQAVTGWPDAIPTDEEAREMTNRLIKLMAICDGCELDD